MTTVRANALVALVVFVIVGGLAACGGGGGGGGSGGSGGAGGGGPLSALTYSGNTNPAVITGSNASQLTSDVMGGTAVSSATPLVGVRMTGESSASSRTQGVGAIGRRFLQGARVDQLRVTGSSALAGVAVDQTVACDSGTAHVVGNIDDSTGTGMVAVSFINCRNGTDTLNGQATLRVDAFDLARNAITDVTFSFVRVSLIGPELNIDMSGSLRGQLSFANNTISVTENLVMQDGLTQQMLKVENLVIVDAYPNVLTRVSFIESVSGRIYDSLHGYVDISTTVPFSFSTGNQDFPDTGQIVLRGSRGATVRATALSSTLLTVALDLDGDGIFESIATVRWTDLGTPVAADLGDADGDGMHNSWETAYGLDPHNPADANLDLDGDGASNKVEYLAGTQPNNPASTPPAVGLSLLLTASQNPATVGASLTYTITVANTSGASANNVVVNDALPEGVALVSASPSQGSCSGSTAIMCSLGTVNSYIGASITLVVTPTADGVITNAASVTSSSFDPFLGDNRAAVTTTVGQPAAGLQGLIDTAASGATITVPPGIYTGGLNFKGKNVTLRSRDGPAATIIAGGNPAVQIGPGGTLSGFTISGASGSFGGGVVAVGTGAIISGNVFDGNAQESGGAGAAIFGNVASATIERNVFRNNTCDTQFLSGVVSFINMSAPQIVNNVFENNACAGINLTLPEGNAVLVANNTFVGNRVGIHVDRRVRQVTQVYRNNLFVNNSTALEIVFGSSDADNPVWTNNLVFGNAVDYAGTGSQTGSNGNISADPRFVDLSGGNYHLQQGSAAVDAGSSSDAPATDFDGSPRPRDGNGDGRADVDIGAFELQ